MDGILVKVVFSVLIFGFVALALAVVSGCAPDHGPWDTSVHVDKQ